MALTVAQIRATVDVDTGQAVSSLGRFSSEMRRTTQTAAQDATSLGTVIKGVFAGNLLTDFARGISSSITGAFKGIVDGAFEAVKSYEMQEMAITQLVATQSKLADSTVTMAQALSDAKGPAAELMQWLERLAIESPFEMSDVTSAFQMAQTYGFNVQQAKRLTQALIDLASTSTKGAEGMNRIALAMGQMGAKGKVTGEELRQLSEAGLPALRILADAFEVTTGEMSSMVEKGTVPAGQGIEALVSYMETNFAGAAQRATNTWQGLVSSLGDIKTKDLRSLFTGIFDAIQPEAARVVEFLGSDSFAGKLREVGGGLGEGFKAGIEDVKVLIGGLTADGGPLSFLQDAFGDITFDSDGIATGTERVIVGVMTAGMRVIQFGETFAIAVDYGLQQLDRLMAGLNTIKKVIDGVWGALEWLQGAGITGSVNQALADVKADQIAKMNAGVSIAGGDGGSIFGSGTEGKSIWDLVGASNAKWDAAIQGVSDAMAQRNQPERPVNIGPVVPSSQDPMKAVFGIDSGKWEPAGQTSGASFAGGFNSTAAPAAASGAKKAASELERQMDAAIGRISSNLEAGIGASISLGRIGVEEGAPGSDSWAENIFRIQDIAQNLGTGHEGADTEKWYQQLAGGMSKEGASDWAKGIVTKFQAGLLMDPSVMPFLDVEKARQQAAMQLEGERQTDQFAQLVGSGGRAMMKPDDAMSMAQSIKGGVTGALASISTQDPTIMSALMQGVASSPDQENGAQFMPGFMSSIDKQLLAGKDGLKSKGESAWLYFEDGFVAKAGASPALQKAIDGMVESAIGRSLKR